MFALLVGCSVVFASENSKNSEKTKRELNDHTYEGYEERNIPRISFIGKRTIDKNGAYSIAAVRKFRKRFDETCMICDFDAQGKLLAVHRTDSFHKGSLSSSNGFCTSTSRWTSGCEDERCTYYSHVYANRDGTFDEQIIFDYILKNTSLARINGYQVGPYTNVKAEFYNYTIHCSSLFGSCDCTCEAKEPSWNISMIEEINIKDNKMMFDIVNAYHMKTQGEQQMKDGNSNGKKLLEDANEKLEVLKAECEQKKLQKKLQEKDELHNSLLK